MYTHAHLRYAEAMAHLGDAEAFFLALRQANPGGPARGGEERAAAPGQLLHVELRRGLRGPLPGRRALRRGEDGRRGGGGRLARLLERRGHRGAARARVPARPAPARAPSSASTRCCRARSTACARRSEIAGRAVELRYRVGARGFGPQALRLNGSGAAVHARGRIPTARAVRAWRWRRCASGCATAPTRSWSSSAEERMRERAARRFSRRLGLERGRVRPAPSSRSRASRARTGTPCGSTSTSRAAAASSWRAARSRAAMPESWALALHVRGAAPANKLELKLVDPSNRNVWWWHRDAFEFPAEWQPLRIRSAEVDVRLGTGGRRAAARARRDRDRDRRRPGGRGTVWLEDLRFEDLSLREPPRVRASSAAAGHPPEHALDGAAATQLAERAGPGAAVARARLPRRARVRRPGDRLGGRRRGARLRGAGERRRREPGRRCGRRARRRARVTTSTCRAAAARDGCGCCCSRPPAPAGFGIASLRVEPFEFSRSLHDFFHAVAARERRGLHPRWLHREQTYWTPVGVDGAARPRRS